MIKDVLMSLKKITFCIVSLVVLIYTPASSQNYLNGHPFDLKKFNLGFLIGLNYNRYNLKDQVNITDERDPRILRRIELVPQPGLTLGMITNFNLLKSISLRFIPAISLEQRNFNFFFEGATENSPILEERKIEASYLNLPLLLQFKSKYRNAMRLYLLTGPQLGFNLASNKKVRDDPTLLKIKSQDLSIVFGIGLNIYGDRIKLSPELRYSAGLTNIYVDDPEITTHSGAIAQLFSQVLTLNVNFE